MDDAAGAGWPVLLGSTAAAPNEDDMRLRRGVGGREGLGFIGFKV